MKKKVLIIVSVFIAILLISLSIYNSQIPDLKLTQNNKEIKSLKCPYSWNTLLKHEIRDYATPLELTKTLEATSVEPNTILNLNFNKKTDNIEISLWSEKSVKELIGMNAIGVPSEKGIYVYRVIGNWKQGTVGYVFKINVK